MNSLVFWNRIYDLFSSGLGRFLDGGRGSSFELLNAFCVFGREGLLARPHALDWSSAGVSLTSGVPTGLAEGILLSKTYVSVSWFRMLIGS